MRDPSDQAVAQGRKLMALTDRELALLIRGPKGHHAAQDLRAALRASGVPAARIRIYLVSLTR